MEEYHYQKWKLQAFLGISNKKQDALLDKAQEPICPLNCPLNWSTQKNLFLAQIKSSALPDQQAALTHLLINEKCRIQSLRKWEKKRKRRWLIKKAKNEFKANPYKAGKNLLDPKCYYSPKVDQETLDQHKSFNFFDKNYDTHLSR